MDSENGVVVRECHSRGVRWILIVLSGVLVCLLSLDVVVRGQGGSAAVAGRMTGRWQLNRDLSPDLSTPSPEGGRRGRGSLLRSSVLRNDQRGGRGGGGNPAGEMPPIVPAEAAAQAALAAMQQVPIELSIQATETEMTIVEPRGTSHFVLDNKSAAVEVPGGGRLKIKSRWERSTVRQDFSSTQRTLRRQWSLTADDHLLLKQRIESVVLTSKEVTAVFERR